MVEAKMVASQPGVVAVAQRHVTGLQIRLRSSYERMT